MVAITTLYLIGVLVSTRQRDDAYPAQGVRFAEDPPPCPFARLGGLRKLTTAHPPSADAQQHKSAAQKTGHGRFGHRGERDQIGAVVDREQIGCAEVIGTEATAADW